MHYFAQPWSCHGGTKPIWFSLGKAPAYKICSWQDHFKSSPEQEAIVMLRSGPVLPQWEQFCNVLQSDPGKCQKLRNLEGYLLFP